MRNLLRRFPLVLALSGVLPMWGCSHSDAPAPGFYQVVAISDIHFNPLYDPTLYSSLVAADPGDWPGVFETSAVTAPAADGTDTNYPLLQLALADIKRHMGASPVVLFTGDLLGHNIPTLFCDASKNQAPNTPCTPSPAVAAMIPPFIDKTFSFVAAQIRAAAGDAPVIYVPGNIDTYGPGLGPDSTFLTNNAAAVYTQLLNGSVDQSAFLGTFTGDGYYSAQPLGPQLLVIGLNSNSFVTESPSSAQGPAELIWLDAQLASAQAAGQTVWMLMHIPPGANAQAMAADTPGQIDAANVSMNWGADFQKSFMQTLAKYPGRITLMLAGHTHMDEFRILPSGHVLEQLPGISPCFGNNPAYKVLTITQDTFVPVDYEAFDYDLAALPAQFSSLYQLSAAYGAQGTLSQALRQLYPQLIVNENRRSAYTLNYASGSAATNPQTMAPWNPINTANWPIFFCAIAYPGEPDYIGCVHSY